MTTPTDNFMDWLDHQPSSVRYHFRGLVISAMLVGVILGALLTHLAWMILT